MNTYPFILLKFAGAFFICFIGCLAALIGLEELDQLCEQLVKRIDRSQRPLTGREIILGLSQLLGMALFVALLVLLYVQFA